MSDVTLTGLMAHGSKLLLLLEQDELTAAEIQMDYYIEALTSVFQYIPSGNELSMEQRQALLQFQMIHKQVADAKHLAEDELHKFSKAGRAAVLYKSNAG